jgi:pimeloyl-ACP methyl ester carboxylesterase
VTYVLIPGAGGEAWYWHRIERALAEAGHRVVNVELPADDQSAGLAEYTDTVVAAATGHPDLVLVAQSLGGFLAPLVPQRLDVTAIVLVNAMIPAPGETPADWSEATGSGEARRVNDIREGRDPEAEFDLTTYFFHDVPDDLTAYGLSHSKDQADRPFADPCRFDAWPDVPITVISGRDDRIFPLEFQRRVARERLGIEPEVVPGGHLAALSHPDQLTTRLTAVVGGR